MVVVRGVASAGIGPFETFENKKCFLETGHPLDHGTCADPCEVADE
jgi:hypothetical protein